MEKISIIGGGLSGCEAALQASDRGVQVDLFEMRPNTQTGAHQTDRLAELVCSNSLGSELPTRPSGLLMRELEDLGSHLIRIAKTCRIPAGHALAIDRDLFSQRVTEEINSRENIRLVRQEVTDIPEGKVIIASGPLTSSSLAQSIQELTHFENLFFFDAVAPIVTFDSINMDIAFWGSRYGRGVKEGGDYINCPFDKDQYRAFHQALITAERIPLKKFESPIDSGIRAGKTPYFEGCLPIEVMAARGERTLAFGPLRPVGLTNPHKEDKPYAVVQLRQDDIQGNLFNLVGFQTNLKYSDQKRVYRMIPGLENAEFERFGQMHRNTFLATPEILNGFFQLKSDPRISFCGQITGVEGYMANIASGLWVGLSCADDQLLLNNVSFPKTTMIGALFNYITHATMNDFQPMKPNFGLLPPLETRVTPKKRRFEAFSQRAQDDLKKFLSQYAV